jgi:hypothetical protein
MISISSPTRNAYSVNIEQGSTIAGTVSFVTRGVTLTPQGGISVTLAEATSADGALQNQPKESA